MHREEDEEHEAEEEEHGEEEEHKKSMGRREESASPGKSRQRPARRDEDRFGDAPPPCQIP